MRKKLSHLWIHIWGTNVIRIPLYRRNHVTSRDPCRVVLLVWTMCLLTRCVPWEYLSCSVRVFKLLFKLDTLHFWRRGTCTDAHCKVDKGREVYVNHDHVWKVGRVQRNWRLAPLHRACKQFLRSEWNEITDPDKRRSIFLVCVGAKTYKLVRSLVATEDPKDKSYEYLAKLLQDHFMPKPSAIVQRFKFNTRSQQPGETIAMVLAELRNLSKHCALGYSADY